MIWHIFYTASTGEISWSTSGDITEEIKSYQNSAYGLSYKQVNHDDMPDPELYYLNDNTDLSTKNIFNPTFSSDNWTIDSTISVTGLPAGTEVFLDGVSKGTMSDTTLNLNINESGIYVLMFKKVDYRTWSMKKHTVKAT